MPWIETRRKSPIKQLCEGVRPLRRPAEARQHGASQTFLAYVLEELLGPPTTRRSDGQATWNCPKCEHSRFHVRPPHRDHADKFSCWRCGFWGDEFDVLQHFQPHWNYAMRVARIETWFDEWAVISFPGMQGKMNEDEQALARLLRSLVRAGVDFSVIA